MRSRVLITRTRNQASVLAAQIEALGAEVVLIPTIELAQPSSFSGLDHALDCMSRFEWLIFTSANAVHAFAEHAKQRSLARSLPRIAVIGPATAKAVTEAGLSATRDSILLPRQFAAESLAETLLAEAGTVSQNFLLVRAEEARDVLPARLEAAGHRVTIAPVYRNIVPSGTEAALRTLFASPETCPDIITFTSSSTARNLFALLDSAGVVLKPEIVLASIGPITSATLRELGHKPDFEAPEPTIGALTVAIRTYLAAR